MPEQYVLIDEEGLPYLQPSSKKYPLYSYDNEFYGIRVGKYELHIKYEDRDYFSLVEVVPQHLTINEWDLLKDDLERELKGLAQDLIRKNIGLDGTKSGN